MQTIEAVLLQFPNLMMLYMHGNQITSLREINKLGKMTKLKKLTFHGNPIEEAPNYRLHCVTQVPQLHMLDFISMTKLDRDRAQVWHSLRYKGEK